MIAKQEAIAQAAQEAGQHSAAVSAYKEVSILSGHRVERREEGTPGEFAMIEAMNRAELINLIRVGLEQGELTEVFATARSRPE